MIVSHVMKESEYKGEQVIVVRGSLFEIDTEIRNIIMELLKCGFPEKMLISSFTDAIEDYNKET